MIKIVDYLCPNFHSMHSICQKLKKSKQMYESLQLVMNLINEKVF